MARTAPVPNIPAIPGMNPGIFVMGGGGGGGGSGGKGGKGGGGKKGANGKNGGKDAAGGGKGAKKCGKGTGSACNSCSTKTKAGDPVDVATGRVSTVGRIDVDLPGPLPLQLERSYSSHAVHRDVGLGWGWTHSYAWELVVRRRKIEVWDEDGTMLEVPALKVGQSHVADGRTVRRDQGGYVIVVEDHRLIFGRADGNVHRLTSMEDANGNAIQLDYRPDGRLAQLRDSVGRVVRVRHAPDGRIAAFEVNNARVDGRWFACGEYLYDARGDLVTFRDAEGFTWRHQYLHDTHLLASQTDPEGLTFHWTYDADGRCVETWGAHGPDGTVRGLSPRAPATLADGTPARGLMHTKIVFVDETLREVIDSKEVRRFEVDDAGNTVKSVFKGHVVTRRYDPNGFLVEHVDAVGSTTTWTRDAEGRALTETDPLGNVTTYQYDAGGRLARAEDGIGPIVELEHDTRGNLIRVVQARGELTTFDVDGRGLVTRMTQPNGGVFRYSHDADGNLVEIVDPTGATWRADYDPLGRMIRETDPLGQRTTYGWDGNNLPTHRTEPNGDTKRFRHDGRGNLVHMSDADGRSVEATFVMDRVITTRSSSGLVTTRAYDRDGFLADLTNPEGERWEGDADSEGLFTEVRSFDGRTQRFRYDPRGRLVRYVDAKGGTTEWTRDPRGQVVAVEYPDGTSATFEHDARGRVVRSANSSAVCEYVLDAADQLVREVTTAGDRVSTVDHQYDSLRRRTSLRTSNGLEHLVARDAKGRATSSTLDATASVRFGFDPLDREIVRDLPAGTRITTEYAAHTRSISRRTVLPALRPTTSAGRGEPPWIGPLAAPSSLDLAWRYSTNGQRILETWSSLTGSRELDYDLEDQLVRVSRGGMAVEEYRYDRAGNVSDARQVSVFSAGNRLERRGDVDYEWDPDGFLVRRVRRRPDGTNDVWTYAWDGSGQLATVTRPDGQEVSFTYDPFARRVEKTVVRRDARGAVRVARCRFVWEKDRIAHEIRELASASGDPIVYERTFTYDEATGEPLAEREDVRRGDVVERGAWRWHVSDPIGTPDHVIADDGSVVAHTDRDAWGRVLGGSPASPLRFDGQWYDEETGLHYNRYRYYDPESGRYISQDPAGDMPDPNLYRYGVNPVTWTDFYGLVHKATATFTPKSGAPIQMNGGKPYRSSYDDYTRNYNERRGLHENQNFSSQGPDGNLAHRTSDTEQKIMRDLAKMKRSGQKLEGGHLQINGELPPCSACSKKMNAFAKRHKCSIQYVDSSGQKQNYPRPGVL